MKKIGILTYHSVYNFGANLQAISTFYYFKNRGYSVKIVDWRPKDLFEHYKKCTPIKQAEIHELFFKQNYNLTATCYTDMDVARVIDEEKFDAIVIGSDAVCRHFPTIIRWRPSRTSGFLKNALNSPDIFPNPYWGSFYEKLKKKIPMILMSVSSQGTLYQYTLFNERKEIAKALKHFSYISVRDSWSQRVFNYFSYGKITPEVTPDPVFAFNVNVPTALTSKEIIERFQLPEKYVILSFKRHYSPNAEWVKKFVGCCRKNNLTVISLPYPQEENPLDVDINISLPISPLEWYNIIKYSMGYIGNNMHPIVVSMHNSVPFISFDYYANHNPFTDKINLEASKIYDLLKRTDLLDYYVNIQSRKFQFPNPEQVFDRIYNFNKEKGNQIAKERTEKYMRLMNTIEQIINRDLR